MFEFVNNRQVIYGEGKAAELPAILEWYKVKKVFFVTYNAGAPDTQKIKDSLAEKGIGCVVYDAVKAEPDLNVINGGRDVYLAEGCQATVALGGGSVIDAAKAINMLAANGGMVEEYQMDGKQVTTTPPLFIALPTTAGTGAEATKVSVVTNNHNGLKKSLYHTTMIADIVILDPALTKALPARLTAATGMDALSHAIESYVSLNASPFSEMYSLESVRRINGSLATAVKNGDDLGARGEMLLGSYLGGCAITAGIGIAHIMAQPIGAMYKIPHGDACSIFLPTAMEKNLDAAEGRYAKLAEALDVYDAAKDTRANALAAIARVKELRAEIGAPTSLRPYVGEGEPDLDEIVQTVQKTTGHVGCNPRKLDENLMREMFTACL